jgi:UDP-glucose 4-epimerase
MATLLTGAAGYIGSHAALECLRSDREVVVLDNLRNASRESLTRVQKLAGKDLRFIHADILDRQALRDLFQKENIDEVIHFAGLKAVGESNELPLDYYHTNVTGALILCEEMQRAEVFKLVFSSSATVYGDPQSVPITEDFPTGPTNPYGRSKWMVEHLLQDLAKADPRFSISILRYFNPIGADESGLIGEDPRGIPNNLLPYIAQVAVGRRSHLQVFGDDYPTIDGTGVRDYIHVVDLVRGHLAALRFLQNHSGAVIHNLGTGQGTSVFEAVKAFEAVSGKTIPTKIAPRRPGDIAICFADPTRATHDLGWQAEFDLQRMVEDAWRFQKNNPHGYDNSDRST